VEEKAKSTLAADHNSRDEDGCGSCSPFFSCEGCICATNITEPITFTPQIIVKDRIIYTRLIQSFLSYNFHSIWQPPQIV